MSPARRKNRTDTPAPDQAGLREEIRLLRDLLHRTALSEPDEDGSPAERIRLLDCVGRACGHLARLLRTQASLGGQDELAEEIGRIAEEIRQQITSPESH